MAGGHPPPGTTEPGGDVIPRPKPKPGPAKKPAAASYSPSTSKNSGAYDLSKYSAGAAAEALQEALDFAGWLGDPTWFNIDAMQKQILQMGLQGDTTAAYEFMWSRMNTSQRADNVNAYFGLTKQQYTEKFNNLKDMYYMYTGDTAVSNTLRNEALLQNWTQSELLTALQADPTVGATSPWLAVGLSYRDVVGQFGQQYGQAPASKDVLGSWWKFRTGAQQVGTQGPAQMSFQPPQPLITRPLSSDVETR